MACLAKPMVVAFSSQSSEAVDIVLQAGPDTVLLPRATEPPTVTASRFASLRACKPFAMVKRKVLRAEEESSEDSPTTSLDGADYTDRGWTTGGGNDWRSFDWAFGLDLSSGGRRRRARRRGAAAKRAATPKGGSGSEEESDIMKELLEIVLWNGEKEIDLTAELTDEEEESDDEEMACIKRLAMAREQTIRPGAMASAVKKEGVAKGVGGGGEKKGGKVSSGPLSVSNLRFDSLLKLGPSKDASQKASIARLEQRTTTMERAFKGEFEDDATPSSSRAIQKATTSQKADLSTRTTSSKTIVAGGGGEGDEENFWDDVEF